VLSRHQTAERGVSASRIMQVAGAIGVAALGILLWYVSGESPPLRWVALVSLALTGIAAAGWHQRNAARRKAASSGRQGSIDRALQNVCDLIRRSPGWPMDPGG
jgi:hypothetical protein